MSFKVIIAGSRDFDDYDLLCEVMDKILINRTPNIEIVCGACRGADQLGAAYAKARGFGVKYFPADWDKFGKAAGFKRNCEMALHADALVAFWDGSSKGTAHMIRTAEFHGLPTRKIIYPVLPKINLAVSGKLHTLSSR